MRNLVGIPRSWGSGLAACLFVAAAGCGEDIQSPSSSESDQATSAIAPALELVAAAANSWTTRAAMPAYRGSFVAGGAPNATGEWIVYVFGGVNAYGETGLGGLSYNVATDTWTNLPNSFVDAANMNGIGRIGRKFYFTGGDACCGPDFHGALNTTWAYDLSAGTVLQRAHMPRATNHGVTGVIKGQLYVLPGYCSGYTGDPGHCTTGGPIRQLYRYDPSTNTWTTRRQAPHFHAPGAAAVINDKLYVVGGSNGAYLDVYDPATNTWQTRAPIPTPGTVLHGAALQAKFFVVSGGPAGLKAYSYNPATDTWTSRAAPPKIGPLVKVTINGQPRLFLPRGSESSYLYTP